MFFPLNIPKDFPDHLKGLIPNAWASEADPNLTMKALVLVSLCTIQDTQEVFSDYEFIWPHPLWFEPIAIENAIPYAVDPQRLRYVKTTPDVE
jgi:hypothetical protein